MADFDVIVIGGGPGGYVAAIRCAQLGLKTACVDDWRDERGQPSLGGTCLNVGCIPSKALLDSSHQYHKLQHDLPAHGIRAEGVNLDIGTMMARKREVVQGLTGGVALLFMKHKIQWLKGRGRLRAADWVEVTEHGGERQELTARHLIIATGSVPAGLDAVPFDGKRVVDSAGALAFDAVPKRFGVIGGGVIALELSSVWSRLGAETTVLVRGDRLLPRVEAPLGDQLLQALRAQGLDIRLGAKPMRVEQSGRRFTLIYQDAQGEHRLPLDKLLVATGRRPYMDGLGTREIGLELDEAGFIKVDGHCRTNLPNVYAIGDVIRGPMLAHKASEEGVAVAERIAGQAGEVKYETIPWVIYTWPELAWVGRTSEQLRQAGVEFRAGSFPFSSNGRARAMGDIIGQVKILSEARSDRILGVHILGPYASEMIAEAVVAMEFGGAAEDLARTVHAHPTLSEVVHEAALAAGGRVIHG